jgi:hypothetical protein
MNGELVCVHAAVADHTPTLSGYVFIEHPSKSNPNLSLEALLSLKVEHILKIPQEDWVKRRLDHGFFIIQLKYWVKTLRTWRYCFPEYDRYPTPGIADSFALKRNGSDRWRFAIQYLMPDRFQQILSEELLWWQDDKEHSIVLKKVSHLPNELNALVAEYARTCTLLELDTFGAGILSLICRNNYKHHIDSYTECFEFLLAALKDYPSFCQALWLQTKHNTTRWDEPEMTYIARHLGGRPSWTRRLSKVGFIVCNPVKRARKE